MSGEEPSIGVFVCHCGANIGRVVDVPGAVEYALTLPGVVHAQEQLFSCATNCAQEITDAIKEKGLNRVVIAACSPRTLEALFRDTLREAGLNQYYLEMANIREHDSWVHSRESAEATRKAKDIIRKSVARARHLEPLGELELPVTRAALVVGGGIAGMTCALSIAGQGIEVHMVEREPHLGGLARRLNRTLEGLDVPKYIGDLTTRVYRHPAVHVHTGAVIASSSGYVGNFVSSIESGRGVSEIRHGATVIATGAIEYVPTEYRYGSHARVLTNLELEERMMRGEMDAGGAQNVVFIQCVGCRNEERDYCSRICCSHSIKNALALKRINSDADVYVLYRDMRTYGFREDYYRLAAEREVKFIRYDPADKPFVEDAGSAMLKVTATDEILGKRIEIEAGFVVLAAAVVPAAGSQDVARLFSVPLGTDGFFKEAHVKLRPVDFNTDGVFLCGTAHYPKHIAETVSQALGAAGRVVALLSHDTVTASGSVCQVTEGKCIGCGACIQGCSYGAISMRDTPQGGKASVNQVLCKGDGLCASNCPTGAITPKHFTDEQLLNEIDAAFERAR